MADKKTTKGGPTFLDSLAGGTKSLRKLVDGDGAENEAAIKRERGLKDAREAAAISRRESFEAPWKDQIAELQKNRDESRLTSLFAEIEFENGRRRRSVAGTLAHPVNFQLDLIFSISGYWDALKGDREQFKYFRDNLGVLFGHLNDTDRIGRMAQILARITKLHAAGRTVLSKGQVDDLAVIIMEAYARNVGPIADALKTEDLRDLPELWRSVDEDESAAAYFERVIAPIPFEMRPTTTQLSESQPDLYKSLSNLCADQKRRNRRGLGEIGQATGLSEVLPMGVPKVRAPRQKRAPK